MAHLSGAFCITQNTESILKQQKRQNPLNKESAWKQPIQIIWSLLLFLDTFGLMLDQVPSEMSEVYPLKLYHTMIHLGPTGQRLARA